MGFDSYHNRKVSPAKVYNRWRGGKGVLSHWDGQVANSDGTVGAKVEEKLPFKFAILEQTRRISGFSPTSNPKVSIRYYSNEAVDYNDTLTVMVKEGDQPAREVCSGKYADIKSKLPSGARLEVQLYVYVPERDQIECISCQGASLSSFIDFSKKNKIYENYVTIERNPNEKRQGVVSYYEPTFKLSDPYTKEEISKLVEKDAIVTSYLKEVHDKLNGVGEEAEESVDQTPQVYECEQSQEQVETDNNDDVNPVDFNAIPF